MKKQIIILLLFLFNYSFAQTDGMSYQAIILNPNLELPGINDSNNILPNKPLKIRFSIISSSDQIEYQEIHQTQTDEYGMINLIIGSGTSTVGIYTNIFWDGTPKDLKVEYNLGGSFELLSLQPLLFTPYAYHRDIIANGNLSVSGNIIGTTDAIDFVTKTNNAERMRVTSAGNVGIGTTTPSNALHVSAATNPLKLSGLQAGSLTTDNILTADATGVVRQVAYNAVADQSLGSISAFAFSAVPADYLECNGAAVSRTTYAALFAKLGTTYGAGDGSTTFNVPDLRGEFIRGWSNGRAGVDVGRAFGSSQSDGIAPLKLVKDSPTSIPYTYNGSDYYPIGASSTNYGLCTNNYMGTGASDTRPRNVAMVYAIKAKESVLVPTATSTAVTTAAIANEPWFNVATGTQATANTQSIYQMGQVLVNTATVPTGGTNAKLIVNSATNGAVQIKDGTQGAGKVLTSDANGVGTWTAALGSGQSWVDVSSTTTLGTTYTNITDAPIALSVRETVYGNGRTDTHIAVNGNIIARQVTPFDSNGEVLTLFAIVPPNGTYSIVNSFTGTLTSNTFTIMMLK
jgi:hypothetical protein